MCSRACKGDYEADHSRWRIWFSWTRTCRALSERAGHEIVILARAPISGWNDVRQISWDARTRGHWAKELEGATAVIDLVGGRSVNCRYHERNRRQILESRVLSTRILGEVSLRIQNAATGLVERQHRHHLQAHLRGPAWDESGEIGGTLEAKDEFSVEVATAWERALNQARTQTTRKVALRAAMVLGTDKNV